MNFVNQKLDRLGLSVQNLDTQVGTRGQGPQAGTGHRVQGGKSVRSPAPGACDVSPLGDSAPLQRRTWLEGSLTTRDAVRVF